MDIEKGKDQRLIIQIMGMEGRFWLERASANEENLGAALM